MENNKQPIQYTTFTGGMDTDTVDSLLQSNKYREARNLRLTTDTSSNTGSLHSIEGCCISDEWSRFVNETPDLLGAKVVKATRVRDIGVVILKSTTTWFLAVFRALDTPTGITVKYDSLDTSDPLKTPLLVVKSTSTIGEQISIVTRYEDSDNIKVYIADGISLMRVINIAKAYEFNTTTQQYTYTDYYLGSNVDKKIFMINEVTFVKPTFRGFVPGSLKTCAVQLCYQLFNKNGSETVVSPTTDTIYVYNGSLENSIDSTGSYKDEQTNKAASFTISSISTDVYSRIKIIVIAYTDTKETPDIYVMADSAITSSSFNYTLSTFDTHLSKYTLEEFNAINGVLFIPSLIETKNNYLFASNIKYVDQSFDVEYDARAYRFCPEQV